MTSQTAPGADTPEAGGLEQQRLAAIVEYCEDAIISLSLDGRVASWNNGAAALFGYTASEMVGQPITRIIPPERYAEEERILSSVRAGETVKPFETQRVRKGGDILDVSLTVSPVKDDAGRVVAASKVARDISARKRTEEAGRNWSSARSWSGAPSSTAWSVSSLSSLASGG